MPPLKPASWSARPALRGLPPGPRQARGVTLIELAVVLLILIALAGMLVPMFSGTGQYAQCIATDHTLANLRDAILGSGGQPGYLSDLGKMPDSNLGYLFNQPPGTSKFNPTTQRGWRGPYLNGGSTCESLASALDQQQIDTTAEPMNILQQACAFSRQGGRLQPVTPNRVVALDSFQRMGPNGALPVRSPIRLFRDAAGHYYLVSAGLDGQTLLGNGFDPVVDKTSAAQDRRRDDRVLYLDSYDAWGNAACAE